MGIIFSLYSMNTAIFWRKWLNCRVNEVPGTEAVTVNDNFRNEKLVYLIPHSNCLEKSKMLSLWIIIKTWRGGIHSLSCVSFQNISLGTYFGHVFKAKPSVWHRWSSCVPWVKGTRYWWIMPVIPNVLPKKSPPCSMFWKFWPLD